MFGALIWVAAPLAAAEPMVEVTDGVVRGHVTVKASPQAAMALLADPPRVYAVSQGEGYVKVTPDGACKLTEEYHPHPLAAVRYSLRVCPSTDSVSAELVRSDDIKVYSSLWRVTETDAGTRLDYQLDVQPDLPLPQWVVNRSTSSSVDDLLHKLAAHLEQ